MKPVYLPPNLDQRIFSRKHAEALLKGAWPWILKGRRLEFSSRRTADVLVVMDAIGYLRDIYALPFDSVDLRWYADGRYTTQNFDQTVKLRPFVRVEQ